MSDDNRLRSMPAIRRARGYRLYDERGRRYLDLFQEGGRAILGHRPRSMGLAVKNYGARGLWSAYPSPLERRFDRALRLLFPGYEGIRWYRSIERAIGAMAELAGIEMKRLDLADPATGDGGTTYGLWRPFLEDSRFPPFMLPVLPLPGGGGPFAVVARSGLPPAGVPSDTLSPVSLAAAVSCIHELRSLTEGIDRSGWSRFDRDGWRRRGPYLVAECGEAAYDSLFLSCLQDGVLINPRYPGPSIVPMEMSEGEMKKAIRRGTNAIAEEGADDVS